MTRIAAPSTAALRGRHVESWTAFTTTLRREIVRILRIWPQTILPPVITTSLYFIIFGPVLGNRIGAMEGFTYLQYVTPGLIMMAVLTNAYQNVVSSFFGAKFQKYIEEMMVSPMPPSAILLGFTAGGAFRGLFVGVIVAITSLGFSHLTVAHPLLTIVVAITTAVAFSLLGFINALVAKTFDAVAIVPTFVLTPLTMLGGVFYSVNLLPPFWRTMSLANPILYMVNAFRFGILGQADMNIGKALVVLGVFIVGSYAAALFLLRRGTGIRT